MDPLTLTLIIIFALTVIGTIVQRRMRDACLKRLQGNLIHVKFKGGKWVWGRLRVFAKSVEILYEQPNRDVQGHDEFSYMIFEDQLPNIFLIVHPVPAEGTQASNLWKKELRKLVAPTRRWTLRRWFRNLLNTLRDAISQSLGVAVGAMRTRNPAATFAAVDQKITSTGQMLVGAGNNAYEPILEHCLGREVVVEVLEGEKWHENVGVLEEYTDKYILLRDVVLEDALPLPETLRGQRLDVIFPRNHSAVRHRARRKKNEHANK